MTTLQEGGASVSSVWGWEEIRPITSREFELFRALILRETGIALGPNKQALLVSRLARRLRELHLRSFRAYYARVQGDRRERTRMVECICTHETAFFREPAQFQLLHEQVFPSWRRAAARGERLRRVRVWSAGCATGEEPYSVAMGLLEHFGDDVRWNLEILATDLSGRVLRGARRGRWPIESAAGIPEPYRKRYMLKGTGALASRMRARSELSALLTFRRVNLAAEHWEVNGPFDLVFCRNVLIYFSQEGRRRVVQRLLRVLAPSGLLLLGHAESLHQMGSQVRQRIPAVYEAAGAGAAAARQR